MKNPWNHPQQAAELGNLPVWICELFKRSCSPSVIRMIQTRWRDSRRQSCRVSSALLSTEVMEHNATSSHL